MSHSHGNYPQDSAGLPAATLALILAAVALVVLLVVVFAWAPWNDDNGVTPGQGGSDTPIPSRQQQQVPPPISSPALQPTPRSTSTP